MRSGIHKPLCSNGPSKNGRSGGKWSWSSAVQEPQFDLGFLNHLVLGPLEFEILFSKKYFSFEEGKKVGTQVSAHEVIECSALENINIQDVFTRAARIALTEKKAKSKGCCTIS